jgi:hypothetical protein
MTRADLVVTVASLLLLPWLYLHYWSTSDATRVQIIVNDQPVTSLSLDHLQKYTAQGKLGPSVIEVTATGARFIESPCKNKFCVHSGWQKHTGDVTACIPNQVALVMQGGERHYDAINF